LIAYIVLKVSEFSAEFYFLSVFVTIVLRQCFSLSVLSINFYIQLYQRCFHFIVVDIKTILFFSILLNLKHTQVEEDEMGGSCSTNGREEEQV
jgi:hypothetical protein